jgi:hypothetical protein
MPDITETEASKFVGVVTAKGHYLLEIDVKALEEAFAEQARKPQPPGRAEARGWSGGIDLRTRITGATVPVEIGTVVGAGAGSGATIGRRIVRTVAHAVILHTVGGGSAVASVRYTARRDEGVQHAADTTSFFYHGGAYLPSGCGTRTATNYWSGYQANATNCLSADWAYLVLGDTWYSNDAGEAGWISWFGYQGLTAADVGADLTHWGYPACDDTRNAGGTVMDNTMIKDPAGCIGRNNAVWRDISSKCEIGSFTANHWKFRMGCDTSPGHSGGPLVLRNTSMLVGHNQYQDCTTCSASDNYPNHAIGHDSFLFTFQNNLRTSFP